MLCFFHIQMQTFSLRFAPPFGEALVLVGERQEKGETRERDDECSRIPILQLDRRAVSFACDKLTGV
ncbi:hypothetical protein AD947_03850 [Acetobacter tropicalis]|uniref:Uncharacterized protein n=1 Tax=Acetobacter tropicalis TaxID=104102 RepID=A0A149U2J2_9PROT|nr:hypothetical protein AD947_03850 [Acetobacter tropicalis]